MAGPKFKCPDFTSEGLNRDAEERGSGHLRYLYKGDLPALTVNENGKATIVAMEVAMVDRLNSLFHDGRSSSSDPPECEVLSDRCLGELWRADQGLERNDPGRCTSFELTVSRTFL
jgi:hypothetical protein